MRKNEWTIEEKEKLWDLRHSDWVVIRNGFRGFKDNNFRTPLGCYRSDRAIRYALDNLKYMDEFGVE